MTPLRAIFADRVIDGNGTDPIADAVLLIEGGNIVAVGPRRNIRVARDAERIDAQGLSLLPGLIDTHVHLMADGTGINAGEQLATSPSLALLRTIPRLRATLDAGFTTVRDAGGAPAGLRRAVDEGTLIGPRIQVAVTILTPTGGHVDPHMPCGADIAVRLADVPRSVADGPAALQLRTREVIRAGADWVKVCASGGFVSESLGDLGFGVEEMQAAVREAKSRGNRRVMAHAHTSEAVVNAVSAGAATIEHGVWLDDRAVDLMARRRVFLVPTLIAPRWVGRHARDGRMPGAMVQGAADMEKDHRASLARALEGGVTVALGTDSGLGPHGNNGEEVTALVDAGMTPMSAIRAATQTAAELLGFQDSLGTLDVGKRADAIAVEGDPLDDIGILSRPELVVLVVKDGMTVKDHRR